MPARFVQTTRDKGAAHEAKPRAEPVLVLAHHPNLARAGSALAIGNGIELSRLAPAFSDGAPLDDPFVSRTPIEIRRAGDAIDVGGRRITAAELARGAEIVVGERVVLVATTDHVVGTDDLGMFGTTEAMHRLRDDIRAAAAGAGPVLVLGETGAGKELVARALHASRSGPFVAVNVAAIPAYVAAAELFGHEKGAFTGADERRTGYFERAAGGTLFLDEIGDLPDAIQPMLLRALESGELQPIGGKPRRADVFVVAATDAEPTRLRAPLYYRLAATTLHVPALRERRADIGPLLAQFLAAELTGELADRTTDPSPWLPAELVAALVRASWPGNVRQLRAVAHRLATLARAGRTATADDLDVEVESATEEPAPLEPQRLVDALRAHRFQLSATAEALGISRTHLDALIAKSPQLRKAKDLAADEITACAAELGGDIDAMAARLEVSPRGLRLRMRQLGL